MLNAGTVQSFATLNDQGFKSGMKNLKKQGERFSRQMSQNFDRIGRSLTTRLTLPLGIAGGAMIKLASDAEETGQKFDVVFGNISDSANAAAKELRDSFGLSAQGAKQLLGDTGDILTGLGFTQDTALDLSRQVSKLSVDLASFTNFAGGAEGASRALTKALLGEAESVKALGIVIRQDTKEYKELVEQTMRAKNVGLVQAKALVALQMATEQSKNAIGDFARTQDSFANQSRQLKAEIEDLVVVFGNQLLPTATSLVGKVRGLVDWFSSLSDTAKQLGLAIAGIAFVSGPTLLLFSSLIKSTTVIATVLPKLVVGFKALTAAMMANPYLAVGAAIAAIGTHAWLTRKRLSDLNDSIKTALSSDVEAQTLESLNDVIARTAERLKDLQNVELYGNPTEEINKVKQQLDSLIERRDQLAAKQMDKIISDKAIEGVDTATDSVDRLNRAIGRVKVAIDKPVDKIFDPSDVVAAQLMRQEMDFFNNTLLWAATYSEDFSHRLDDITDQAETSTGKMEGFAQAVGNMFERAVLHGNNLQSVLKGIGKQLAAKAFVTGLGSILTGGASLGGESFLSNVFGGLFHSGGMVPGSGDKMIRAKGGEMVLTPSQQKALSMGGGQSVSINPNAIGRAVGLELDKRLNRLSPEDVFVLSRRGSYSY